MKYDINGIRNCIGNCGIDLYNEVALKKYGLEIETSRGIATIAKKLHLQELAERLENHASNIEVGIFLQYCSEFGVKRVADLFH